VPPAEQSLVSQQSPILGDLDRFTESVKHAPLEAVHSTFDGLCRRLEIQLCVSEISSEDLCGALENVWTALDIRFGATPSAQHFHSGLMSAVVSGIANSRVFPASNFQTSFWSAILTRLARLPVNDALCDLFELVIATLPREDMGSLSTETSTLLNAFFKSWESPEEWDHALVANYFQQATARSEDCQAMLRKAQDILRKDATLAAGYLQQARDSHQAFQSALNSATDAMSSHRRQIRTISKVLSQCDGQTTTLEAANLLLEGNTSEAQVRYNWLLVLAQYPRFSQQQLLGASDRLFNQAETISHVTDVQLCRLLIHQWASRGYLTCASRFESVFDGLREGHKSGELAALAYAVYIEEKDRKWLVRSLCDFLKHFGRLAALPGSFEELGRSHSLPVLLLQRIATACNDYRVAMALRDTYVNRLAATRKSDWDPRIWWKYLDDMFRDLAATPNQLWEMLGIGVYGKMQQGRLQRCSFGSEAAKIVVSLAARFAEAEHIGNRAAFRQVSQCVRFLESYKKAVPQEVLQALYHVVSRDLAEGRPGRSTRLQWFLGLVDKHQGSEVAEECRQRLQRWRGLLRHVEPQAHLRRQAGAAADTESKDEAHK
jgi:hypothetical protein